MSIAIDESMPVPECKSTELNTNWRMMSAEVDGAVRSNCFQMSQTVPDSTLPHSYPPPHVEQFVASYLQVVFALRSGVLH